VKILTAMDIAAAFPHIPVKAINLSSREYMPVTSDFFALDVRLLFLQEPCDMPLCLLPFHAMAIAHRTYLDRHPNKLPPAVGVEIVSGGCACLVAVFAGQEDGPVYYNSNLDRCDAPTGKALCLVM